MKIPKFPGNWILQLLCAALTLSSAWAANPFLHPLFTDHMVLQRDAVAPVWGWTTPGNSVTVTVKNAGGSTIQAKTGIADSNGRWQANLDPMGLVPGNAAYSLTISDAGQTVTINDVLIGDVFLCSGQSNMAWKMSNFRINYPSVYDEAIADSANYPLVRSFYTAETHSFTPKETVVGTWEAASPTNTPNFSATAYFMGRELFKQHGVPIGLLTSAVGGTAAQFWIDSAYAATRAEFAQAIFDASAKSSPERTTSSLFNGMIAPLAPYGIRAAIWYQGEADSGTGAFPVYNKTLPGVIQSFRNNFGQPTLPFLVVQLTNFQTRSSDPVSVGTWAEQREVQMRTVQNDPNTRLIITIDLSDGDLHPGNKPDVGLRASWAASELVYGQPILGQGPLFTGAVVEGNTIRCSFDRVGAGLMVGSKPTGIIKTGGSLAPMPGTAIQEVVSGTLTGFAVAGADKVFYHADASIDATTNTVVVSSPSVPNPVTVRYGWGYNPPCNLYAKITDGNGNAIDGLPVAPFRNDPIYTFYNYSGGGDAAYALGQQVSFGANTYTGQTFDHWFGDTQYLSGTTSASTSITISEPFQSVVAKYRVTGAPTVTVTPIEKAVTVSWSAMTNLHFNVKRATSPSGPFETIASNLESSTLSYTDTSVALNQTYYYVVSAIGLLGEGPDSTPTSGVSPIPPPPMNATAPTLTWDPLKTGTASNGAGLWNNSATNFAASGTNVAYTPTISATVSPFASGTTGLTVSTSGELLPGLGSSLSQFPSGATIGSVSGSAVTMSVSSTASGTSAMAATFSPNQAVVFGGTSGTAGIITVSGTQSANAMTLGTVGSGTHTFEGGAIQLGTNYGATGKLSVRSSALFNSPLLTKSISFETAGHSLTLAGGGTLSTIAGTNSTIGAASTVLLSSGSYSGLATFNIGDPVTGTGGVVVGTGSGTASVRSQGQYFLIGSGSSGMMTVNVGGTLTTGFNSLNVGRANGSGRLVVAGGTVDSGIFPVQIAFNAKRGLLEVVSGTLFLTGTGNRGDISICGGSNTATHYGEFNLSGGVVTTGSAGTISLGGGAFTGNGSSAGTGVLNVTGGSLYIGSGGIVRGGSSNFVSAVNLSGGTVGAVANWSSVHPITLGTTNGPVTFRAANSSGTGFDIQLGGVLSGPGGLIKSGGGTLTLSNTNSYSGNTVITAGTLALSGSGSIANSPILEVRSGATFDAGISTFTVGPGRTLMGSGTVRGSILATGLVSPGSAPLSVTGNAVVNGTLAVTVNGASGGAIVTNGILDISGATLTVAEGTFTGPYIVAQSNGGALVGTFGSVPAGYRITYTSSQAILHNYDSWAAASGISGADPSEDSDGDGQSNAAEFAAGTHPLQSASTHRIGAVAASGSDFVITFPSVYGRSYRVERSDNLADSNSWTVVQDNLPGTGSMVSATDPGAALEPRRFYRVIVKM